jgi:hypothetical protein
MKARYKRFGMLSRWDVDRPGRKGRSQLPGLAKRRKTRQLSIVRLPENRGECKSQQEQRVPSPLIGRVKGAFLLDLLDHAGYIEV